MGAKMLEIRWHGRGGQGAKTAATLVAEVALGEGRYSQGFPDYGPERMGAPVRGFTRISEEPIRLHSAIERPDVVVVLDDTLLDVVDVCENLTSDGIVIVNSDKPAPELRTKLGLGEGQRLFAVNATQISIDELGRSMPNTPMIGALVKATGALGLDSVYKDIEKKFLKKFGDKVVRGNIQAVRRAHEEVTAA